VTSAQSRLIIEIDGRPAAQVYDEWLGGAVSRAAERGEDLVEFCTLYPICRPKGGANQFIRAWPSNDPEHPGSLRTGSAVQAGDEIYLSEGNGNILLNQFATLPLQARDRLEGSDPLAGLFIYCGAALDCIPEEERPLIAALLARSLGSIPWIGVFTWGEQGNLPGVGNVHANLSSGTVLFPAGSSPH